MGGGRTYLFRGDEKGAEGQTRRAGFLVGRFRLIVVENVEQHRGEEKNEAARAALNASEAIRCRTREDGKPQMTLGQAVIRFLRQEIGESAFVVLAGDGQKTFDLAAGLLHRQPVLKEEIRFLQRLQIAHDDVFEKPRGRIAFAGVVVPDA